MTSSVELPIERIVRVVSERLGSEIAALYVFGSAARGELRPESDIDLAFLGSRGIAPELVIETALELGSFLDRDVDLIDLEAATTVMRVQVIGRGRRVYTADEVRTAYFEMYALSDYARLNEERAVAMESFLARYRG